MEGWKGGMSGMWEGELGGQKELEEGTACMSSAFDTSFLILHSEPRRCQLGLRTLRFRQRHLQGAK